MVMEYLAPISSAVGIVKTIKELWPAKTDDNGIREQLSLLMERLLEAQQSSLAIAEENLRLRQQVEDSKKELAAFTDFEFREEMYWRKGVEGSDAGPFCQVCMDRDAKPVRLHRIDEHGIRGWCCKVCQNSFNQQTISTPQMAYGSDNSWGF